MKKPKYIRPKMNALQAAQLKECLPGMTNGLKLSVPREMQKGFSDTPLFSVEQPKLF